MLDDGGDAGPACEVGGARAPSIPMLAALSPSVIILEVGSFAEISMEKELSLETFDQIKMLNSINRMLNFGIDTN